MMRKWAREHGLEALYDEYLDECRRISDQCVEEGYPSHGCNYDLRVEDMEQYYPELFGDSEA